MKELRTTYKELFDRMVKNPDDKLFIKTRTDSYARINAMIHKKSDTYVIDFDNEASFVAGDKHVFMNAIGEPVMAQDLEPGEEIQTIYGQNTRVTSRYDFKKDRDVYDICIDDPHWYTNDESHGIIHHNTSYALLMAAAYLNKYKDAVLMFYDSEFGSPENYFTSFGIDPARVLHIPITDVEELKFDIINQLEGLDKKDKVIIVIDSIGNLASKKELQDAKDAKSVADMSRAKAIKGLFRMVTPFLTIKDVPCLAVNHTYQEQCLASDTKITMHDNSLKQISDVIVGDKVLTRFGNQEVTHVFTPEELGDNGEKMLEIEMEDGFMFRCTGNHRFLVNDEWIRADELNEDSEITCV